MKVLQFIPSLNKYDGGTTTYMQQLAPVLGQAVELHVCALTPVSDFVELQNCVPHSIPLSMMRWRQMKREWIRILDEVQPDVVHFNGCWMPQIASVIHWTYNWRGRQGRPKMLLTPHGMLEPWILKRNYWTRKFPAICLYQRRALKEVDCIVATAQEEKEHLLQLGWNNNIALIQNGIRVDTIVPKTEWSNRRKLLFMSRVHPKKGLEMLFEALRHLQGKGVSFELQIAGDGEPDYVARLKESAPEGVCFLGPVYGATKWKLIQETDVVILPSFSENYGLIVAESLASATPVIVTKGAPWACVEANHAGWWVSPTVEGLEDALKSFSVASASDLAMMGNNARRLAEEECSVSQTTNLLLNLYNKN